MNIKLSKIRRRDIGRRFELLGKACHNVAVRGAILILQTLALALLRCFFSRYKFPTFSPQENPVVAHPSQFVRVIELIFLLSKFNTEYILFNETKYQFQFFSTLYVHALNMWLLICPDWLVCDWSHNSFQLIENWLDYRIIFAVILYIFIIRTFIVGPR